MAGPSSVSVLSRMPLTTSRGLNLASSLRRQLGQFGVVVSELAHQLGGAGQGRELHLRTLDQTQLEAVVDQGTSEAPLIGGAHEAIGRLHAGRFGRRDAEADVRRQEQVEGGLRRSPEPDQMRT